MVDSLLSERDGFCLKCACVFVNECIQYQSKVYVCVWCVCMNALCQLHLCSLRHKDSWHGCQCSLLVATTWTAQLSCVLCVYLLLCLYVCVDSVCMCMCLCMGCLCVFFCVCVCICVSMLIGVCAVVACYRVCVCYWVSVLCLLCVCVCVCVVIHHCRPVFIVTADCRSWVVRSWVMGHGSSPQRQ